MCFSEPPSVGEVWAIQLLVDSTTLKNGYVKKTYSLWDVYQTKEAATKRLSQFPEKDHHLFTIEKRKIYV